MTEKDPRHDRPEDEFSDDADELENEQLESPLLQKILSPFYLLILVVGVGVALVPFMILYTVGWMIWDLSRY